MPASIVAFHTSLHHDLGGRAIDILLKSYKRLSALVCSLSSWEKSLPAHDILAVRVMRLYVYRLIFVFPNKDSEVGDKGKVDGVKRRTLPRGVVNDECWQLGLWLSVSSRKREKKAPLLS